MELGLAGRKAVVTGAGDGIGLAVVRALTAEGAQVLGGARTVGAELLAITPHTMRVDLATPDGPAELVGHALELFGGLDILVNNVGGGIRMSSGFLDVDDETWQRALDLNFFSTIRATRAALPSLIGRKGTIVNIGSVNARQAEVKLAHYSAAKAALVNLGKALAQEFGPRGVRVNTISPGPVRTRVWTSAALAEVTGMAPAEFVAQVPKAMGMATGRMIETGEVAALVVLLASDRIPSVVGAEYLIDAGMCKST
ncbi:NAD(P)-dependent dehydrogenase (short-subunit alcohol dehydrogenase family) [Kibdelosporangium banguiense]|uniref:NAD(P)-dependent dehydrogenase (Short-subunit alcohol dehydrogenase family) n=1 Tax=Kibdelosporangium banguiense TaxID=1365924 RepID=A0ABS4TS83_9PSEU|nr:SDR family oxidoreductase [Kibdelosporangium banguiense]MBP2327267.1 NAD(P)-dependent dehydrogenase (short-subunit alcohol dehydrogenase family) [Kibdelosporangium banguiense]